MKNINIRWIMRPDLTEVIAIEKDSFEHPWVENDFIEFLRKRECISLVAEIGDEIVGFICYELHPYYIELANIAVAPKHRRGGIGRVLIERLLEKLNANSKRRLVAFVRESNLPACYFLKACGLRAEKVVRNYFEEYAEDAIRFEFCLVGGVATCLS